MKPNHIRANRGLYIICDAIPIICCIFGVPHLSLALQHRDMPFTDTQGLVYDGSYKLGVLHNIVFINIFDVRYKNSSDHIVIPFVARSDGPSSEEYKRY